MVSAEIDSGICGFGTTVRTKMEGRAVRLEFETTCGYVERLAEQLTEVESGLALPKDASIKPKKD